MGKFSFSQRSLTELYTAHGDLQKIFNLVIKRSKIDFGVSEGYRSIDRQHKLFMMGRSKIDGITKTGKHNYSPSLAIDIYCYHPNKFSRSKLSYDRAHLAYIAGLVDSVADELFNNSEITHKIRWGGNWDRDGVIDFDQDFDDFPHFELYEITT